SPEKMKADYDKAAMLSTDVKESCDKAKTDLGGLESALKSAKAESAKAMALLEELKRTRDAVRESLEFEEKVKAMKPEPLVEEFNQLRKALTEKTRAIKGHAADYSKAVAAAAEARAKLEAVTDPPVAGEPKLDALSPLEKAARKAFVAQQQYGAHMRTIEER